MKQDTQSDMKLVSCKCRLDAIKTCVCNNKQGWNEDKCRCERKELIDRGMCDKGIIWNPSNCECECNKSCDVGEYLDYRNCMYRQQLVDKLVEECSENINENRITNVILNQFKNICSCCTIYTYFL